MTPAPKAQHLARGELVQGHDRAQVQQVSTYVRQARCDCGYRGPERNRAANHAATAWCQADLDEHLAEAVAAGARVYRPGPIGEQHRRD